MNDMDDVNSRLCAKRKAIETERGLGAGGSWGQAALEDCVAMSGIHTDPRGTCTDMCADLGVEMWAGGSPATGRRLA